MNTESYKRKLLAEEHRLTIGLTQADANTRDMTSPSPGDAADLSVNGDLKEEQFRNAEMDWNLLRQIREALQRIENGTYGKCIVDGAPIEENRLNAVPSTPYCKKHQDLMEGQDSVKKSA